MTTIDFGKGVITSWAIKDPPRVSIHVRYRPSKKSKHYQDRYIDLSRRDALVLSTILKTEALRLDLRSIE